MAYNSAGHLALTTSTNGQSQRLWLALAFVAALLLVAGCSYPNQFRNVSSDTPHAVLVGQRVTASHINQQPTSFWRSRESYRIPPGPTTVRPVTGFWDFQDYPVIEFTAIAGHRYTLTHQQSNDSHRVLVWARPMDGADERVVAEAKAKLKRANE
jgi:hypothetical protein